MLSISEIDVSTIFVQILILFALAFIGFGAAKSNYLPQNSAEVLSKFVVRVSMPMTILSKMLTADFSKEDYQNGIKLYLLAITFLAMTFFLACLVTKGLRISETAKNVYKMQAMFGNVIFFAFPLFLALFGDVGIIYALFFNMGNDTFLWTLGVFLANRHKGGSFRNNVRHLINANTITFAVGLLLMLTGVGRIMENSSYAVCSVFYRVVSSVAAMVGSATSPLSMIFIGMILAGIQFSREKSAGKWMALTLLSFQKLLFFPLCAIPLLLAFRDFLGESVVLITVLQLAMPVGTLTASLASEYGSDYEFAAQGILITTVFSLGTMPLVVWILQKCSSFI